ncbi:DUF2182 domain-containing protein [Marinobacter sp. M216]|uniref:DUF2182 domain-containing protein n=1 Tax=Marinobacter albus TaxID=3030833 RepID=A0ABT7H9D3_9GAMM|nr:MULTISPECIES: DUF2182 domain-containing protein [unclassified Marinobacter]MBW7470757.1 DUF2182 domain-containing protein [Marinobacter sp. F4218]MDK9556973.1 DUF2182 domain-containing protein [Marinobacter sp. M216]
MGNGRSVFSRSIVRGSTVTLVGLLTIAGLCWLYVFGLASEMASMSPGDMMAFKHWTPAYFAMMVVMWSVMMVAMMTPSAAPMILLYRQVARKNQLAGGMLGTALFAGGYLLVWGLFSLTATALQWLLEESALLSPQMRSQNQVFSGVVLIAAGIYQFSSLKQACLRRCRGPLLFITRYWRSGLKGAFEMGLRHGTYCVGCCAALMALLFVGGVMDLSVIAAIAVVVLLEKLIPGGEWLARAFGALAIGLGVVLIV